MKAVFFCGPSKSYCSPLISCNSHVAPWGATCPTLRTTGLWNKLKDYRPTIDQLCTSFCSNMMKQDRYKHILRFLRFTNNRNEFGWVDKNFDRLCKIWNLFEILRRPFFKFYTLSKNLAMDKVIVLYKERVIFKQYIPEKQKCFGIIMNKLCYSTGYIYDLKVYLGKNRQHVASHVTATHAIVTELTRKIEGCGHKLYISNYFSSSNLFDDLAMKQIYCYGMVGPTGRGATGPRNWKGVIFT